MSGKRFGARYVNVFSVNYVAVIICLLNVNNLLSVPKAMVCHYRRVVIIFLSNRQLADGIESIYSEPSGLLSSYFLIFTK